MTRTTTRQMTPAETETLRTRCGPTGGHLRTVQALQWLVANCPDKRAALKALDHWAGVCRPNCPVCEKNTNQIEALPSPDHK